MLVSVLRSFLIGRTCNIEQSIDTRFHCICALIPKLERLLRVGSVFVDHFVNQVLNRRDVLRSAELEESVGEANVSYQVVTSRMLFSMLDLAPVRASKTGLTDETNCFSMMT